MRAVDELLNRRRARRWQHWTEVDPVEDYARLARVGTAVAVAFFLLVFAAIAVGLILALT